MTTPVVSVVCATYRRPQALARLLGALARQDLGLPFEVVVSDDGSGDLAETRALVAASPLDVRLLEHPVNRGQASARNDGWRAARADVVAFTDDDCQPAPGWLRAGLSRMAAGDVVVVGRVDPDPAQADRQGPWSRSLTVHDARFLQTANAFYRRSDLEAVGGFDEALRHGGEDTDLGMRVLGLGRRSEYADDALVLHDVRPCTVRQLARESATRWTDLPLVVRKHPVLRTTATHRRWFWKRSHPGTLLALGGLALAPVQPAALLLLGPWLVDRGWRHPPYGPRRDRLRVLPGAFVVDVAEVVGCVRGSVRHRSLLL
jgi:glycosyltransferase involved in cell wall biosynthesis